MLVVFKYAGLFTEGAADLASLVGLGSGAYDGLYILLPLAISFFTFEMISVLVDVYRGDTRVGGFLVFATYKAFFPKLLSGPITRYRELAPQLETLPELRFERFQSGLWLVALGLFKKLAIANNLALIVDSVYADTASVPSGVALVAILAFGFQIYFDFSAYIDIARGVSRMMGLELPINFRLPYAAASPSDFWRRWNISLSRFLRDYLYIPLGGNRGTRAFVYRNLMITMILGGLWHGAGLRRLGVLPLAVGRRRDGPLPLAPRPPPRALDPDADLRRHRLRRGARRAAGTARRPARRRRLGAACRGPPRAPPAHAPGAPRRRGLRGRRRGPGRRRLLPPDGHREARAGR
jgi:hypothetical protein